MPTNLRPTTNGNAPEDWQVFEVLFGAENETKTGNGRMTTVSPLEHQLPSYQVSCLSVAKVSYPNLKLVSPKSCAKLPYKRVHIISG